MKVDFNNLRLKALKAHDSLIRTLNEHILSEGYTVHVDCDQIASDLEDLRQYIGGIAMVYEEGNDNFKNVFEDHYPEGKSMAVFNPEPDEIDD
jgi:hypothetical protein